MTAEAVVEDAPTDEPAGADIEPTDETANASVSPSSAETNEVIPDPEPQEVIEEPIPDDVVNEAEPPTFIEEELPPDFWDSEPVDTVPPEQKEVSTPSRGSEKTVSAQATTQTPTSAPAPGPVSEDAPVLEHLQSLFPGRIVRIDAVDAEEDDAPPEDDESTQVGLFD